MSQQQIADLWRDAEMAAKHARIREAETLNRTNKSQAALDSAIAELRKAAPRGSGWTREVGVEVERN